MCFCAVCSGKISFEFAFLGRRHVDLVVKVCVFVLHMSFMRTQSFYVNLSYVLVAAPRLKWCACRVFVVVCYSNVF